MPTLSGPKIFLKLYSTKRIGYTTKTFETEILKSKFLFKNKYKKIDVKSKSVKSWLLYNFKVDVEKNAFFVLKRSKTIKYLRLNYI